MKACRGSRGLTRGWQSPLLAACGVALLVACAGEPGELPWTGSVRDSAGVRIVTNPQAPLWPDGEAWTLSEELRIGSFAEDPDYQFGQVGSIAVDSQGRIHVMDRQARQVRVYSPEGSFVRAIGTPGRGPGEMGRGVADVLIAPGDTLLIPDVQNRRINRFSPEGVSLGSAPLNMDRERPLRFDLHPTRGTMAAQVRPLNPTEGESDAIRVIEPTGRLGDTLLSVPTGGLFVGDGRLRYFTPEPMWDVTERGSVLFGMNSDYRISEFDRSGEVVRIIEKPAEQRPISDRDIRAFFAYLDRAWLSAGVAPSQLEANHRAVSFAEHFPAFSIFHEGPWGSLWVQPVRAPGEMSDSEIERYNFIEDFGDTRWEVFDREGRYLGVVTMPERFQPRVFLGETIYGVARDEFDVQYVVRLRISTAILR